MKTPKTHLISAPDGLDISSDQSSRRYDVDWLRLIAFMLLIYFHAAIVFIPAGIPMIQNHQSSLVLQMFVAFLQEFRLGLLFIVSGIGVSYALGKRDRAAFFRERAQRLLVPLVFGILVVVPPMVYLEKLFTNQFNGSFWQFYPEIFQGVYPTGALSWHHYWFVAYLFIFCILAWPIMQRIRNLPPNHSLAQWLTQPSTSNRLFVGVLPLLIIELTLRAHFPGFRDLINDWASFTHWAYLFLVGFVIGNIPGLLNIARAARWQATVVGTLASTAMFLCFFSLDSAKFSPLHDGNTHVLEYIGFITLKCVNAWSWLLACLGWSSRWLNRPSRFLTYANAAVYPVFCLHLPVSVGLSYLIVRQPWVWWEKYLFITTGVVVICFIFYELIKRSNLLRPLFGLKPIRATQLSRSKRKSTTSSGTSSGNMWPPAS